MSTLNIDVEAELRQYDWTRATWTGDKLIAASPFRYDNTPSFFVRLSDYGQYPAGTWADSGAYDSEWASGNIVKLLAFLRNESYEETEEYLQATYGFATEPGEDIRLKPIKLRTAQRRQPLVANMLDGYAEDYAYLESRGISAEIQRQAGVKYDAKSRAAVIPWSDEVGRLRTVKFRSIRGKTFWYTRGATPVRELLYGAELVAGGQVIVCEAEVDALSWRQAGYTAIAVGGASFGRVQADILRRLPIDELIIATDNDKAGEKLRRQIAAEAKCIRVKQAYVSGGVKDANDALVKYGVDALRDAVEKSEERRLLSVKPRGPSLGK